MLALLATAALAQTAIQGTAQLAGQTALVTQGQRPAMAEAPNTDGFYRIAPDALVQDGVPQGEIRGPFTLPSQAYPGTQHTYWV